ncbi:deoxyuridine 5'-triphosphate nucleotidohydrolase [Alkalihalobacillus sp. LMS6]|uniref:dUTP diphosphatase n=1 Tax=Alkalihalobacillus sp. LMS6 TaxID=2924034 RepID=UPI0020D13A1F|nr:deoxyuridine 5'-triphosphate nucleotidohydrolase [Alkalihalobacillus sp. LMS6]UTR08537.1 deoxyuridine 5'-triphosphate nucleotidohydrolase [Alkalihalobacillus sp. LMS6]
MADINVKVKRLHSDAVIPQLATAQSAGFDLVAVEDVIIEPGDTVKVPTGLAFELPPGYEMQIRPRSGVTLKTKLRVQFGTVDADYRGEVAVIVDNTYASRYTRWGLGKDYSAKLLDGVTTMPLYTLYMDHAYIIRAGDRIAQAVIQRVPFVTLTEVGELGETGRGAGGFGSTGTNTKEDE